MSELNVRITDLEPMRVASGYGFGEVPEEEAWDKILAFAQSKGIDLETARFFGFNNPDPSPGSPNYGYEQWITVDPDVEPDGDIRIVDFPGGLYAVTRFTGLANIGRVLKELVHWVEDSAYGIGSNYCLENLLTPKDSRLEEWVFDLYLPVVE